jgi:prepilin-type N-terminal cleavage/methylation domain-containing protein
VIIKVGAMPTEGSSMAAGNRRFCARLRAQDGFTLMELLTAMAISLAVGAAALTLVDIAAPQADRELQREVAISEGRSGLERMLREIRNADSVNATSPTLIDVDTPTASGAQRVVYECNSAFQAVQYRQCVRYSGPVNGSVSGGSVVVERLINGTTSQPVFTYSPDRIRPVVVRVQLVLPASGGPAPGYMHRVVFRDAAFLRNLDLTGG